jgi:hypothetical protein
VRVGGAQHIMTDVGNIATIIQRTVADIDIGDDNARARCSRRAWSTEPAAECNSPFVSDAV